VFIIGLGKWLTDTVCRPQNCTSKYR